MVSVFGRYMWQRRQQIWQAACCLLCLLLVTNDELAEGGEFIGGRVTGPLFRMADTGYGLFALALLLTFVYRRIAAAVALIGCALSVPYLLYVAAPGAFRWIFSGPWSGRAISIWTTSRSVSVLVLAATTYVCVRGLSSTAARA